MLPRIFTPHHPTTPREVLALSPSGLTTAIVTSIGGGRNRTEETSWINSLRALAERLCEAGLEDVAMLVEYHLPLSSKRADVVVAGTHPLTGEDVFMVVELKQWSWARRLGNSSNRVVSPGRNALHPGIQVQGYLEYMTDFLSVLAGDPCNLLGVTYLHNADVADVADLYAMAENRGWQLFAKDQQVDLVGFLRSRLSSREARKAARRLLWSEVSPSKQLLRVAADVLAGRDQFRLLDEQREAALAIVEAVDMALRDKKPRIVVVSGGPGSGKSAIALTALADLAGRGYGVAHATGSKAFTESMRKFAGKGSTKTKSLFKFFNSFMSANEQDLTVLFCDEAQRIRHTSANRFTRKAARRDRSQLDELIDAARVTVFFLDEHQRVRPGEIGTRSAIIARATERDITTEYFELTGQFRCGGSGEYDTWVRALLNLPDDEGRPATGSDVWSGDGRFQVRLADSPEEMENLLAHEMEAAPAAERARWARIAAGFCWGWDDPVDGVLVDNVTIGAWKRPWNLKGGRAVAGTPAASYWATQEGGFGQIGCIYTAQGFEFPWAGVIIGPDLVVRDGRLAPLRAANLDPALKSRSLTDEWVEALILNTYKVLLTRGLIGVVIHATDPETQAYLRARIKG